MKLNLYFTTVGPDIFWIAAANALVALQEVVDLVEDRPAATVALRAIPEGEWTPRLWKGDEETEETVWDAFAKLRKGDDPHAGRIVARAKRVEGAAVSRAVAD